MSAGDITKTMPSDVKHDWSQLDAVSDSERHAAALDDPDARPLAPENMQLMRRTPQVRVIRRALGLSQEEFSERFRIPIGTLRIGSRTAKTPTPPPAPTLS